MVPVPHLLVPIPTCSEAVVPVPNKLVPVPQGSGAPVHIWYRYHTYWYWYQHEIFAGLEQNSNLGARVHLSFNHHFEIIRRMLFKPIGGQRRAVFYFRVWFWTVGVSLSYFARVYRVEYLSFLRILSFQLLVIFQLVHTTWYFLTRFCAFDIPILQLKCYFSSHIYA